MEQFGIFNRSGLTEILTDNIINYFDYSFIKDGGYTDVERGNPLSVLYRVDNIIGQKNTVWASRRKNWVWENGYGIEPKKVWVNNQLVTTGYRINYRDGCIIFDSPISPTAKVEINYSYKYLHLYDADENGIFRSDADSFNVSDVFINGSTFTLPDKRIQLPSIGFEVLAGRNSLPYELGNYSQDTRTRVLCNILSTDSRIAKRISDYFSYKTDRVFVLFDRDLAAEAGDYPFNYDGTISNTIGTYDYLAENYPYTRVFSTKASISDVTVETPRNITSDLTHITVRFSLNCIY